MGTVAAPLRSHSPAARVTAATLVTVVMDRAAPMTVGAVVLVAVAEHVALVTAVENRDASFEGGNEEEKPSVRWARKAQWAWSRQT